MLITFSLSITSIVVQRFHIRTLRHWLHYFSGFLAVHPLRSVRRCKFSLPCEFSAIILTYHCAIRIQNWEENLTLAKASLRRTNRLCVECFPQRSDVLSLTPLARLTTWCAAAIYDYLFITNCDLFFTGSAWVLLATSCGNIKDEVLFRTFECNGTIITARLDVYRVT